MYNLITGYSYTEESVKYEQASVKMPVFGLFVHVEKIVERKRTKKHVTPNAQCVIFGLVNTDPRYKSINFKSNSTPNLPTDVDIGFEETEDNDFSGWDEQE